MEQEFKDAADEQLLLLIYKNNVPSFYELFERCRYYCGVPAKELQELYPTVSYDEGELNSCVTKAFYECLDSFDFKSSLFKNFFIKVFRRYYSKEIKQRSKRERKEFSLDEFLTPYHEEKYKDVLSDGRDYYQEFCDLVSKQEMLSTLKTKLDISPKAKAIVLYKYYGYSFREIAKIMKLSMKQIRYVYENPKLKYKIKMLIDEIINAYNIPTLAH